MWRAVIRPTQVLLWALPSLALLVASAIAATLPGVSRLQFTDSWLGVSMLAAAIAPLVAAVSLRFAAPGFDQLLFATTTTLMAVGSSTLLLLATTTDGARSFYTGIATRHGFFVAAGCAMLVAGALVSKRIEALARFPYILLLLAISITALTASAGVAVNGARLWLQFGGVRVQPSEAVRLLLAVFAAIFLYERRHLIAGPWRVGPFDLPPAPYLAPLALAVCGASGMLVLQNDLGMASLVGLGAFATFVAIAGAASSVLLVSVLMAAAVAAAYVTISRVQDRVAGWLNPWSDPALRGFQFIQADYAFAAGGIGGSSTVTPATSVPEIHTDFILAGVAAVFGASVALAVLALAGVLFCRCVLASLRCHDGLRALLVLSLTALIAIQVALIAGGTLRILPLTGLTFPFVSYGGSSMLATSFAVGVVLGIGSGSTSGVPRSRGVGQAPRKPYFHGMSSSGESISKVRSAVAARHTVP